MQENKSGCLFLNTVYIVHWQMVVVEGDGLHHTKLEGKLSEGEYVQGECPDPSKVK